MAMFARLRLEKILQVLLLVASWHIGCAQTPATWQTYTDARAGYRVSYPPEWQVYQVSERTTAFFVGTSWSTAPAVVTLRVLPLPATRRNLPPSTHAQLDSVWNYVTALPRAQIIRFEENNTGRCQQVHYDYAFDPSAFIPRSRVVGRQLWYNGAEYRIEYRAATGQNDRYLAAGRQLVESLSLLNAEPPTRPAVTPAPAPSAPPVAPTAAAAPGCDGKFYGIAALRIHDDLWEDDCRTIHEFAEDDPTRAPKIHRNVLPFQSYALAKGFDNCLYSVTKAPTNKPEYVYRYNPATRKGEYTPWQLPAQGVGGVWISGATDERGDLYFSTSDGNKLVKIQPATGAVSVVWNVDPVRRAPYYAALGFAGAGTHANFCIDTARTLCEVYSADGSLLRVNLDTQRPAPELLPLDDLPERGGYSGILLQHDAAGKRWLFLAGPQALYQVDPETKRATRIRKVVYTDLAGCNLFQTPPPAPKPVPVAAPTPAPTPPTVATVPWRGRVLDAATLQPLPQAQLQLRGLAVPIDTALTLTAGGAFQFPTRPYYAYAAQLRLSGYIPNDTVIIAAAGPYAHDILLRPLALGATQPLENVQFAQGRAELLPASYPALNQLLTLLAQTPGLTIELRGHTDNVGDPQKNVELSQQRVEAVKAYLVAHGVDEERISGIGLGGAEPRASNAREETRRLNRRVEFRVTRVR